MKNSFKVVSTQGGGNKPKAKKNSNNSTIVNANLKIDLLRKFL